MVNAGHGDIYLSEVERGLIRDFPPPMTLKTAPVEIVQLNNTEREGQDMAPIEKQIKRMVSDAENESDLAENLAGWITDMDEADLAEFSEHAAKILWSENNSDEEEE